MTSPNANTLRLIFPQWQGGDNPPYFLGAQLLAWLAPPSAGPVEEVPVAAPDSTPLQAENGIVARAALNQQIDAAQAIVQRHQPQAIAVLGGDCLVSLVPFAWLSERYGDKLGVLWIDAHPDVQTPAQFRNAHAHVLGALACAALLSGKLDHYIQGRKTVCIISGGNIDLSRVSQITGFVDA